MASRDPDQALYEALRNPLRRRILRRYVESEEQLSPKALAQLEEAPLSQAGYHVRVLKQLGAIEVAEIRPTDRSLEHFYRPADVVKNTPWVLAALGLEG